MSLSSLVLRLISLQSNKNHSSFDAIKFIIKLELVDWLIHFMISMSHAESLTPTKKKKNVNRTTNLCSLAAVNVNVINRSVPKMEKERKKRWSDEKKAVAKLNGAREKRSQRDNQTHTEKLYTHLKRQLCRSSLASLISIVFARSLNSFMYIGISLNFFFSLNGEQESKTNREREKNFIKLIHWRMKKKIPPKEATWLCMFTL